MDMYGPPFCWTRIGTIQSVDFVEAGILKNNISEITTGSSRGATLSFTLRSKGEGGQPRYPIIQEIASHFSTPPPTPPLHASHAP